MFKRIAASGMLLVSVGTLAQPAYPTRTVRLVVPFSPGGATDVPARILGQKLTAALGQQVLVDNRPGAGGTIGADIVAKSPPDGHTLLLTATTHVISAGLYRKLPYDAINDFVPVTKIASAPNVLVIHPSLPAKSVRDLVALAASRPGSIDFASSGNGSSQHLFGALFMSMAKIKMNHIPYKGSAQATTDLVSGQVSVGFPGIAIALPQTKAGRMRSLAVTSAVRSSAMPEIPTISEGGVKGYEATLWLGLLAPKNTRPEPIDRLHREIDKILKTSDAISGFQSSGTDVSLSTPGDFGDFVKAELAKWTAVIKSVGAQAE